MRMKHLLRRLFRRKYAKGGHIGRSAKGDSIPIVLHPAEFDVEKVEYIRARYGDKTVQMLFFANLRPWHDPAELWAQLERHHRRDE